MLGTTANGRAIKPERTLMLNALVNEDDIRRVMDSRRFKDTTEDSAEDMTVVVLEKRVVML